MKILILLALFSTITDENIQTQHIDVLELNHFYDENGRLVFDQYIFWEWDRFTKRFQIKAWRLKKPNMPLDLKNKLIYVFEGNQRDKSKIKKIYFYSFRESWTQYDPELLEREFLSREGRKEL